MGIASPHLLVGRWAPDMLLDLTSDACVAPAVSR
jgi:hypothetical protein